MENLEEILRAKVAAVIALEEALRGRVDNQQLSSAAEALDFVTTWAQAMAELITTP